MCLCACTQLYISPPFSPLFFISVCFPLCFGNWTRSAVISSENAASGGILDPGTEAKASGITGESPRSPESRRRLFAGWEHASVTRQLARQMLRGLGEGRQIPETPQPRFLPFPPPPFLRSPYENSAAPHLPEVTQPDAGTGAGNPSQPAPGPASQAVSLIR